MNVNDIRCAKEDAWKEFERTGEIANSAGNILTVVDELQARLAKVNAILNSDTMFSYKKVEQMRELTEI